MYPFLKPASLVFKRLSHTGGPMVHMKLYTKQNCMLCEEAKSVLNRALKRAGNRNFDYEEVDIEAPGNGRIWDKYRYDVPVVDFERLGYQKVTFMHRLDENEIVEELDEEV